MINEQEKNTTWKIMFVQVEVARNGAFDEGVKQNTYTKIQAQQQHAWTVDFGMKTRQSQMWLNFEH